ncbi:hypothetical protein KCU99_g9942, partial [Aureobasidium melanogenum]|uniref:Trichothecene 3-O-acetyltransferase n=1 Tax=Aureobasidium pullulans TaxID=5580 RepID=A0A4T0BG08_AURPU
MTVVTPSATTFGSVSMAAPDVYVSPSAHNPPAHTLELSQLEQSNPRGWVRLLCFFKSHPHIDSEEIVRIFREGLKSTLQAIPSLVCEIVPFDDGKSPTGKIALKHGDFGSLRVQDLRGSGLNYEKLQKRNFPQSWLKPADLCACGVFPKPDEQQPVFIPRLNVIEGGFILTLHCHHSIFDAQGINEVLRVWARNCHHLQDKSVLKCDSLPVETFDRTAHNATHEPTAEMGRPEHHPELIIAPEPITFGETAMKDTHQSRVYRVSPEALTQLELDCSEVGEHWTSTNDRVTALIWHSVVRAQVDPDRLLDKDTLSHHIVNVDLRLRSEPPLSKSYPGCPMNYARAAMRLRDVYKSPSLAPIAFAIREAIDKRTPEYVRSLITLLANVPGYDHVVSASFPNLMANDCLTSTWYKLDIYDLDFGPAIGKIERVRFPTGGLFNGLSMIYPQVTRGEDSGMEIAIGLDSCNFEKLDRDPVWRRYTEPTDFGYDCL